MHALVFALAAGLGHDLPVVAQIQQRRAAGIRLENDVSAISAISAERSTVGNIFFMPETDEPVAAVAGFQVYLDLICKH